MTASIICGEESVLVCKDARCVSANLRKGSFIVTYSISLMSVRDLVCYRMGGEFLHLVEVEEESREWLGRQRLQKVPSSLPYDI